MRGVADSGADATIAATISAAQADTLSSGVWKPAAAELARGAAVGRHVILGPLGAGGMGVVYAAYDPELDRKVALKLLRDEPGRGADTGEGAARLLREAQALARLSHPNVVAVHDAGAFGDRVYLAMEHVEGVTLRSWVQAPRRWDELLAVMLAVGRGLAAAHAAGLVHRDVKPDNVMIGNDGRPRVTDFGLARATEGRASSSGEALSLSGSGRLGSSSVTRTGATPGTPAYMAPEQWIGREADARTDQFAFCVTLWEALFGERPFAGETLVELAPRVLRGEVRSPLRAAEAPGWLRRVVGRGLQAEPGRRWPDMPALLSALDRGRGRARRGWLALGLAGLLALGAGALGMQQRARARQVAACTAAGAEVAEVWHADAKAVLRQALGLTGVGHADETFARLVPWVDRWAAGWSGARAQVCREALVDGSRPRAELAKAEECLGERRDELAGLLQVLAEGEAAGVSRAVTAVAGLSSVAGCVDAGALARRPAPPEDPAARAEVAGLYRELMRIRGLRAAGRHPEGMRRAEAALAAAEALGHAPLVGQARRMLAGLAVEVGEPARAEAALVRVHADAGAIGDDELATAAAIDLVGVVGVAAARPAEGLVWSQAAAMLVARLGQTDALAGAELDAATAAVHTLRGDLDAARTLYGRALAGLERVLGAEHPRVAAVRGELAGVHRARGELAEAEALLAEVLASRERVLGAEHPLVAATLGDLAAIRLDLGDAAGAEALLERALPIQERALGGAHPDVAATLGNLASALLGRGEAARATALFERSLAIQEEALGPEHPDVARSLHNLAVVHGRLGRHPQAVALHERALEIRERALGPDHAEVLQSLDDLAFERRAHAELAAAAAQGERALALRERTLPAGHTDVAWSLEVLAEVRMAMGELDGALPLLERAHAIRLPRQGPADREVAWNRVLRGQLALARGRADEAAALLGPAVDALAASDAARPVERADARFALARALGRRHARAEELAAAAIEGYRAAGDDAKLRAAEAWLGH